MQRNYSDDKMERVQQLHEMYTAISNIENAMKIQMWSNITNHIRTQSFEIGTQIGIKPESLAHAADNVPGGINLKKE